MSPFQKRIRLILLLVACGYSLLHLHGKRAAPSMPCAFSTSACADCSIFPAPAISQLAAFCQMKSSAERQQGTIHFRDKTQTASTRFKAQSFGSPFSLQRQPFKKPAAKQSPFAPFWRQVQFFKNRLQRAAKRLRLILTHFSCKVRRFCCGFSSSKSAALCSSFTNSVIWLR